MPKYNASSQKNDNAPDFTPLENLLVMDFAQLRAVECEGGRCASDEAINLFVSNLLVFFSQFQEKPSKEIIANYKILMDQIVSKINEAEYAYALAKYMLTDPQQAELMAECMRLKSFQGLPIRMQYWAASPIWGDPIRNEQCQIQAVKHLDKWADFVKSPNGNQFYARKNKASLAIIHEDIEDIEDIEDHGAQARLDSPN